MTESFRSFQGGVTLQPPLTEERVREIVLEALVEVATGLPTDNAVRKAILAADAERRLENHG